MILELEEAGDAPRIGRLAKEAGVSTPSISEAVKIMADKGFLEHEAYGAIKLSPQGRASAESILRRYRVLYQFFKDILGLDDQQAKDQACLAEHAVKEQAVMELTQFVDRISNCDKATEEDCDCCMTASICRDKKSAAAL
jgi:DtxR family Mn-dependent transcriptional regulator